MKGALTRISRKTRRNNDLGISEVGLSRDGISFESFPPIRDWRGVERII